MEEIGYVTGVREENAFIRFSKKSSCIHDCNNCKSSCTGSNDKKNFIDYEVKNTLGVSPGDKVKVTMKSRVFFKMVFLAYGLPLIFMLLGTVLGMNFFKIYGYTKYEFLGSLVGLFCLGVSYYILGIQSKKMNKNGEYTIEMIEILR